MIASVTCRARPAIIALFSLLGAFQVDAAASRANVVIDVIADDSMSPPGRPDLTFSGYSDNSFQIDDGAVYFSANASGKLPFENGLGGYFRWKDGELSTVVDTETAFEGGESKLSSFEHFDADGNTFVFAGRVSGIPNSRGAYKIINGKVTKVFDKDSSIENTELRLAAVGELYTDGKNLVADVLLEDPKTGEFSTAFIGSGLDGSGLRVLVDDSTPYPDQPEPLQFISGLSGLENGRAGFFALTPFEESGSSETFGVYTVDMAGDIEVVANGSMIQPGTDTEYNFFSGTTPSITGDTVAFAAINDETNGIYGRDMQTGETVIYVDGDTEYPDAPGQETVGVTIPSIDGDDLAFTALVIDGENQFDAFGVIMARVDGELYRILGEGDMFQGREVSFVSIMNPESFEGGSVVFYARFTDGFDGMYVAHVIPAPGTAAALVVMGGVGFFSRRW